MRKICKFFYNFSRKYTNTVIGIGMDQWWKSDGVGRTIQCGLSTIQQKFIGFDPTTSWYIHFMGCWVWQLCPSGIFGSGIVGENLFLNEWRRFFGTILESSRSHVAAAQSNGSILSGLTRWSNGQTSWSDHTRRRWLIVFFFVGLTWI